MHLQRDPGGQDDGPLDGVPHALRDAIGVDVVGRGQHERELVAAPAEARVGPADGVAQRIGYLLEAAVALEVTEGVVDALEAGEVGDHHREGTVRAARPGHRPGQRLVEGAPVPESREGVDARLRTGRALLGQHSEPVRAHGDGRFEDDSGNRACGRCVRLY